MGICISTPIRPAGGGGSASSGLAMGMRAVEVFTANGGSEAASAGGGGGEGSGWRGKVWAALRGNIGTPREVRIGGGMVSWLDRCLWGEETMTASRGLN
jgi:hypothetical protein